MFNEHHQRTGDVESLKFAHAIAWACNEVLCQRHKHKTIDEIFVANVLKHVEQAANERIYCAMDYSNRFVQAQERKLCDLLTLLFCGGANIGRSERYATNDLQYLKLLSYRRLCKMFTRLKIISSLLVGLKMNCLHARANKRQK